jgi:hypothetical protein
MFDDVFTKIKLVVDLEIVVCKEKVKWYLFTPCSYVGKDVWLHRFLILTLDGGEW